ncbi:MAG: SDR family oxidoreductase [Planctomycetes bacterium]|nr:SDR family oxidoreductase [Planctomycetota bacterium]
MADSPLAGRVAVVTGASRGIGRALALGLARAGADLVVAAKTESPDPRLPGTIHETCREVEALGRRALPVRLDVRDEAAVEAMAARTLEVFGRVDVLVNNAGAIWLAPVERTPLKRYDLLMGVNVRAAYACARAVLPSMLAAGWGHIVNMSPPCALEALPGATAYFLSKFGMTLLTYGLAGECAGRGVAVHSLWPVTMIESQATIAWGMGDRHLWRSPQVMVDALLALVGRDPSARTGMALTDEEVLRGEGVTDFSRYACVPGSEPPAVDWAAFGRVAARAFERRAERG